MKIGYGGNWKVPSLIMIVFVEVLIAEMLYLLYRQSLCKQYGVTPFCRTKFQKTHMERRRAVEWNNRAAMIVICPSCVEGEQLF